jgi:hypothetical protein
MSLRGWRHLLHRHQRYGRWFTRRSIPEHALADHGDHCA